MPSELLLLTDYITLALAKRVKSGLNPRGHWRKGRLTTFLGSVVNRWYTILTPRKTMDNGPISQGR
jgi:hypothetical protein